VIPPPLPENREYLPSYARAIASLLELGGESSVTRIAIRIGVSDRPNLGLQNATTNSPYSGHHSMQASQASHDDKKHKRKSSMGIGIRMSGSNALFPAVQPSSISPVSNRQSMVIGTGDQNSFSWEVWDCVRTVCDYHPRLGLGEPSCRPASPKSI
jgi:protein arginine N-methyltransferase 5